MRLMRTGFWLLALASPSAAFGQQAAPIIAVLEQAQCAPDTSLSIRPLFVKTDRGWDSLATVAAQSRLPSGPQTWTIAFNGRMLGRVESARPVAYVGDSDWYSRDWHLNTAPMALPLPRIPNRKQRFEGWCAAPPFRPLVLISKPFFEDPARWTLSPPTPTLRQALLARVHTATGPLVFCPQNDTVAVPYRYRAADLVISDSYRDRRGRRLVSLGVDPSRYGCDGLMEQGWAPQWFLLGTDTLYLGCQMDLVDAGDYGHDGVSELLFWYSGYNEDGYVLYTDTGRRLAAYLWHYH